MTQIFKLFNDEGQHFHVRYTPSFKETEYSNYIVIHMHGLASAMNTTHNMAMTMAFQRLGCATLQIDARNTNGNYSSGDLADFTIEGCVDDILTTHDWLDEKNIYYKNQKIIFSGHSMGGGAVVRASMEAFPLSGVVSFSPVVAGDLLIEALGDERKEWEDGIHEEPNDLGTNKSNIITSAHWDEWRTHNLRKDFSKVSHPVYFIGGDCDPVTPMEHAIDLSAQSCHADYMVIEGANHRLKNVGGDIMGTHINAAVERAMYHISHDVKIF